MTVDAIKFALLWRRSTRIHVEQEGVVVAPSTPIGSTSATSSRSQATTTKVMAGRCQHREGGGGVDAEMPSASGEAQGRCDAFGAEHIRMYLVSTLLVYLSLANT